ncbi:MAG: hypothetical protein JXR36_15955, partial [Bacteroidales bacterium]|nr:hypothetical protein [Bacteroidales bacterium]
METDLHLTGKSGNDSDETQHRRCLINWFSIIAIFFILFLPSINYAQSGLCDAGVPFEVVDLSSSADATWISPTITRAQQCCGLSNPDRCLEFEITLHPDAIAINFDIASGAVPPGAMFYQINCGPPVAVGTPVCISGVGPHTLTFCKPGNNANTYAVTSIPDPSITDPNFATENCPAPLTITGMLAGSITITDLTGGGTYLSYLSCTDCENPIVTPTGAFPAYADYEICGTPAGSVCLASATYCDTVRVYFYDTIVTNINPNPAEFCAGEAGVWLYSDVTHGVPPYVFEWYDQHDGLGNFLSTNEDYFATTAGNYSLIVYDSLYPQCGPFIVNATVIENPIPTLTFIPNSPYICENDSIDISVNGALSYSWSPGTGLSSTTGSNVTAFPTSTTTYTVTGTDINGCTTSTDITVMVCSAPPVVAAAGGDICLGESFQLQANGALVYEWSPATGLNDPNISDPIATPTVTTDYIVTGYDASCTVIENGDFSNGNTGFTTEYNYSSNLFPEGNYMIGTNPNTYHTSFATCGDHTTGSDNMMIVNGNTVANQEVWCQNITVRPNTDYVFSTWITSVHPSNPAVLQFSIDGTLLGSPFTATSTTCDWNEFYEVWNSGASTSIQICIVNQNTIASGNDFAIDDVFFAPLCPATDTVTVVVHNPPTISFSNTGPFCETEPATDFLANPTGGIWSGTGITDPVNGTFNPGIAGSGTHIIQYSYNDGYCQVDTSINIIVDAVVDATITPVGPFCETDAAVILTAVSPGGTWAGTGVVGNN